MKPCLFAHWDVDAAVQSTQNYISDFWANYPKRFHDCTNMCATIKPEVLPDIRVNQTFGLFSNSASIEKYGRGRPFCFTAWRADVHRTQNPDPRVSIRTSHYMKNRSAYNADLECPNISPFTLRYSLFLFLLVMKLFRRIDYPF